ALFEELGGTVVVKPQHGRQGKHVYLGLDRPDAVREAFAVAGAPVVVEQQVPGEDYRVLMVGDRVAAAAQRMAAHVVGDGSTAVAGLVARANEDPRRGLGHSRPLTRLSLDEVARAVLRRQELGAASVPAEGRVVWLRDNANLSTGGTSVDV